MSSWHGLVVQTSWGEEKTSSYDAAGGSWAKLKNETAMHRENTDKAGWIKVSTTFSGAKILTGDPTYFRFLIKNPVTDIYIDDISFVKVGDESNNLLAETTFEVAPSVTPAPTFEPSVTPAPASTKSIFFGNSTLDKWATAGLNNNSGELAVETATGVSYSGHTSLHVKVKEGDKVTLRPQDANGAEIKAITEQSSPDDQYEFSFYVKGALTQDVAAGMGYVYSNQDNGDSANKGLASMWKITDGEFAPQVPEDAAKAAEGWVKYSLTIYAKNIFDTEGKFISGNSGALGIAIGAFTQTANCDIFIDDVSLVKIGDSSNSNFVANPGFEGTSTKTGVEIFGAGIFDEDGNRITQFTAELSGKTVTAAAYLVNYDQTADLNGMLILAYKTGYTLQTVKFSADAPTAVATGEGVMLTAELTLPDFTDASGMKLQAMVWDGYDTMIPLCDQVSI